MVKLTLDAGACGYKVLIEAKKTGKRRYKVRLISPCEMVQNLNKEMKDQEFGPEIFSSIMTSPIYSLSSKHLKHVSCPLPSAILKAIETEDDLAVQKDAIMLFEDF